MKKVQKMERISGEGIDIDQKIVQSQLCDLTILSYQRIRTIVILFCTDKQLI